MSAIIDKIHKKPFSNYAMYLLYYNQNWKSLLKYHSHSEESANVREDEGIWKSRLSSLMNEFEETGYIPVQKKNQLIKDVN